MQRSIALACEFGGCMVRSVRQQCRSATMLICLTLTLSLGTPALSEAHAIKLSGPMPAFGQVFDFRISPDNRNVVYVADQESDNIPELYSVPIGGGTPIR